MDNEKMKELEEFCEKFNALDLQGRLGDANTGIVDADHINADFLPDLIKYVRQLEKTVDEWETDYEKLSEQGIKIIEANTELLEALGRIEKMAHIGIASLSKKVETFIIIRDFAHEVYGKHKGE